MHLVDLDRRSLAVIDEMLAGASAADLERPTPCAGWSLADLLRHQIGENHGFAQAVHEGRATAQTWASGAAATDLFAGYRESVGVVLEAFGTPDLVERQLTIHDFGTFPGGVAVTMHLIDTVVHGWDVAASLGVAYRPDPEAVAACLPMAEQIPDTDGSRGPGRSFSRAVAEPVPAARARGDRERGDRERGDEAHAARADHERLLRLLGRDPAWTP